MHSKRLREDDITFMEEDADGLLLPHNDALWIQEVQLLSYNGEYWSKLNSPEALFWPQNSSSDSTSSVTTRGEILLLTNAEGVMKTTLFEAVDGDMGHNIILGRPWLHEMKVVPLTYHQLLKFPTSEVIKQIRGDQPATREMNTILVSSSKGKKHMA
ncbi:uncharacterized protein [Nicotiana tomentosiformis]|uniref:uncharacterized protein n=1 Tax=Nicotiana tomentosiformis TaxID=4098 RepID=UPI00388C5979